MERKILFIKNIIKLIGFSLVLPESNAQTERVSCISNNIWCTEKSQMGLDKLECTVQYLKHFYQTGAILKKKITFCKEISQVNLYI